jgi:hypothetical protein
MATALVLPVPISIPKIYACMVDVFEAKIMILNRDLGRFLGLWDLINNLSELEFGEIIRVP